MSINRIIQFLKMLNEKIVAAGRTVQAEPEDTITLKTAEANRRRKQVIEDFARHVELHPLANEIRDISTLPHPKEEILSAYSLEIVREEIPEKRDLLKSVMYQLAEYQTGVGTKSIRAFGINFEDFKRMNDELKAAPEKDLSRLALAAANRLTNPEAKRYWELNKHVEQDRVDIENRIRAAELMRVNMPLEKKRTILG